MMRDTSWNLSEVVWSPEASQVYIGSPSVLRTHDGRLLTSSDRFGKGGAGKHLPTFVYESQDDGTTWAEIGTAPDQFWSNLFQVPGDDSVYLLGTSPGTGSISISRSDDGGRSWAAFVLRTASPKQFKWATGPTPSLVANGKVYRAIERWAYPFFWGVQFQAQVMWAELGSNLTDPASWQLSRPLPFDGSFIPASWGTLLWEAGFLEGNAVLAPDGVTVLDILRFSTRPYWGNYAITLSLNETSGNLTFVRVNNLPGGHSKFVIHRDMETSLYLSYTNSNTNITYNDQRNELVLVASLDLQHWEIVGTVLNDDTGFDYPTSVLYTGFHYVDWRFDGAQNQSAHCPPNGGCGPDALLAIRTAYRGAQSFHNSNRLTALRIRAVRQYFSCPRAATLALHAPPPGYSLAPLGVGQSVDANGTATWGSLPFPLRNSRASNATCPTPGGWLFTRPAALSAPAVGVAISATAAEAGRVFALVAAEAAADMARGGWTVPDSPLLFPAALSPGHAAVRGVFRDVEKGDTVSLPVPPAGGFPPLLAVPSGSPKLAHEP